MAEKVTSMILKVDLQCPCCYKKVKKILCKFPQIRDQVYDEKQNLVKITVVSCCPEKIRDKLCCKGGKVIKSIEIVVPPKPKPKQPEQPKGSEKPKQPEKPKEPEKKPKEAEKKPKVVIVEPEKPKDPQKAKPPAEKPKQDPKPDPPKKTEPGPAPPTPKGPEPAPGIPRYQYPQVPPGYCCVPCSEGYGGGPCHYWCGRPVPPPPCYDNYGYGYGYGYGKGWSASRCDYFSEENTGSCSIM